MDTQRFDDMVRGLSERGSRRGVLGRLAGGVLAALAGVPAAEGPAKAKKKQSGCPKKPCPRGHSRNKRTCKCECTRTPCRGGMEFDIDSCRCTCPRGLRECRDGCVGADECCPGDPPCSEDPKGCCHSPGVEVCTIDGCCLELDGMKACNDFCVDTKTHRNHCGNCNTACGTGESCVGGECGPGECGNGKPLCGDRCCGAGEACCGGVCQFQGTAICTNDGWCPTTSGQACCGTGNCANDPCCLFSAGEACCVSLTNSGDIETTCCPGGHDQCAPGGCCPAGMTWGRCDGCCPRGGVGCDGCVAPVAGRG